jgi:aspartyl-tRNA(Asn)/glutamyl-tRNA(Gln) amidotransferase subunit A
LRKLIYSAVEEFFVRYDVLVTPTTPVTAFPLEHNGPETVGGFAPGDRVRAIVGFCCPFNLTGHPAISVPWPVPDDGLPAGLQVVGPRFREDLVLRVGRSLETGSNYRHPAVIAAVAL